MQAQEDDNSESLAKMQPCGIMTYETAMCLRSLCHAQGKIESHAACLLARVSSSMAEKEARVMHERTLAATDQHVESFMAAGGSQDVLKVAKAQVSQGIKDVLAWKSETAATMASLEGLWAEPWRFAARMARFIGRYWALHRIGDEEGANRAKVFLAQDFHRCHWTHPPWRGANLGGWLLLEPGPASPLFDTAKSIVGTAVGGSEWDLCAALDDFDRKQAAPLQTLQAGSHDARPKSTKARVLDEHRARHYTADTMARIKAAGLNAVRIPFGYWIVTGATNSDIYHGPALHVLDEAVRLAAEAGLQVVLDLHGCPGGENGLRPCGREKHGWSWQDWRMQESLQVLRIVAQRYCGSHAVTGIQVSLKPQPPTPSASPSNLNPQPYTLNPQPPTPIP